MRTEFVVLITLAVILFTAMFLNFIIIGLGE